MKTNNQLCWLLGVWCCLSTFVTQVDCKGNQLGEYIKDFSPQVYDVNQVNERHQITKRSIYDKLINLQLNYHGKKLDLSLYPADDGVFHPEAKLSVDGVLSDFDNSHLYNGKIIGDPGSHVSGSVIGGVFQGIVTTGSKEVYHVDRKAYHPSHPLTDHERVHSVLYREADVDLERFHEMRRKKRSSNQWNGQYCGHNFRKLHHDMELLATKGLFSQTGSGQEPLVTSGRGKRATPTENTCNLYMQSDPELWEHIKDTLKTNDKTMIKQEISALFSYLVTEVNGIYKTQEFNGKKGYEFRVDRLAINSTCPSKDYHWFCEKSIDVANFLNLNTYTNHDDYCLAYILTYRDFADGTLGLAWVAKPGSGLGGICSKYLPYQEGGSKRKKSLNTGVVTVKNYGERVPKLMSKLTLAHEIGHNFGSEHDPSGSSKDCTPYKDSNDEKGNYIMYYAAITGKRANNILFSPCSVTNISLVLDNSKNTGCLLKKTDGHCGNQIKESLEQCDCGYEADCPTCCKCCVGRKGGKDDNEATACKLQPGKLCDPSQGPCCSGDCNYHNATVCRPSTECAFSSTCDGLGFTCPDPAHQANLTECNGKTQICINGECTGSICSKIRGGLWKECSLSSSDTGVSKESLCTVSCMDATGTCYSSYNTGSLPADFEDMLKSVNGGKTIAMKPGSPCDKDLGFCDYFDVCRKIDDLGPLARLKKLLLSFTSVEELVNWLKVYWWVVLLSVIGLVTFMALLVKFGTVFTPSSNPDKGKARKITKPFTKPRDARRRAEGPSVGSRRGADYEMTATT